MTTHTNRIRDLLGAVRLTCRGEAEDERAEQDLQGQAHPHPDADVRQDPGVLHRVTASVTALTGTIQVRLTATGILPILVFLNF